MITVKDVEHVAKLARLELTEEEKELYTKQLGDVLKYVDQMNEVDTSNVKPMTQVIDFSNVTREDIPNQEISKEALMSNAPDEENGNSRKPQEQPQTRDYYSLFIIHYSLSRHRRRFSPSPPSGACT